MIDVLKTTFKIFIIMPNWVQLGNMGKTMGKYLE